MLSVEEAPVVSVPLSSVPLVAPSSWMQEPAPPEPAPAPPRFMSQDEDEAVEEGSAVFFSASAPSVATVSVAAQPVPAAKEPANFEPGELELVASGVRPQFAELSEEAAYTPLPRDYASDFVSEMRGPTVVEEPPAHPATALFSEPEEEAHRDLDTPTFLRRLTF
jgi:hypothetical protein